MNAFTSTYIEPQSKLRQITNLSSASFTSHWMTAHYEFNVCWCDCGGITWLLLLQRQRLLLGGSRCPVAGTGKDNISVIDCGASTTVGKHGCAIASVYGSVSDTDSAPLTDTLKTIFFNGWPQAKQNCPKEVCPYWNVRNQLSVWMTLYLEE